MSRNIHEPSLYRQMAGQRSLLRGTRRRPGAFRWWVPGCDPNDPSQAGDGCTGDEPPLQNSFAQPAPPLEKFAFRLHADGSLEFTGHLDVSGATSGTVAFTLPGANAGEIDFRPSNDQFFTTVVYDGATPRHAMVKLDSVTGDVTLTWPIT
jgi:hypothetical protein